ncbi:FHA domain-containing protein [Candidatus Gracilibacteria bacterium]|nr:FHA domain-containing protein [Candidatus Gracilibacteria bacterium]NJP21307.1 FHA domain-containing protein [Hydrococcus sp. CRU_1_1]
MIVCPHCNHQNPDEAIQCEACYTPLPTTTNCPNCGAPVQTDATFCGQCGFNLQPEVASKVDELDEISETIVSSNRASANKQNQEEENAGAPTVQLMPPVPDASAIASGSEPEPTPRSEPHIPASANNKAEPELDSGPLRLPDLLSSPLSPPQSNASVSSPTITPHSSAANSPVGSAPTRLQIQTASLLHVQTQTRIELPYSISVIHIGKPNEQIPPDIDVSGFPDSEIVSRIHADIRVEGDNFYIEDTGSSNGTYINHTPLSLGNRHRLRSGDRISLGKGDKMTFIFQIN